MMNMTWLMVMFFVILVGGITLKETIYLSNKDLNESIFKDVMFCSFAEGGAMGEPGRVLLINKDGQTYHFNYVYDDIDMEKVEKLFPVLGESEFGMFIHDPVVPRGWNYLNLGMGNYLFVNDEVYSKFMELLDGEDDPPTVYSIWIDIANSILNTNSSD